MRNLGAWYFKQLEESIRDTFRALWMISFVRDALANGSNLPIYHSDYLFPYSYADNNSQVSESGVASGPSSQPIPTDATDIAVATTNTNKTPTPPALDEKTMKRNLTIQVIRKIFELAVQSYVCPLYNWSSEGSKSNHGVVWRNGGTAVVMIDIVTDRRKLKVKYNCE